MASCLTEVDKERCRYHLGYMGTEFAPSIQLGIPRPTQTLFLLEQALQTLVQSELVCARIRRLLGVLDNIEKKMESSLCMLGVERLDSLVLHPMRGRGDLVTDSLEREYARWSNRLADTLGVPIYPYSERFKRRGPGTSVPVVS